MKQVLLGVVALVTLGAATPADADYRYGYGHRHYYSSWSYSPQKSYYYRRYHYKPYSSYSGYKQHYCIYYPSKPRYVYYYNPHRKTYWGRLDLEGKEGEQYSLLAPEDRKENLEDIPEKAFPKPGAFPKVPDKDLKDDLTVPPMKDGKPKADAIELNDPPADE